MVCRLKRFFEKFFRPKDVTPDDFIDACTKLVNESTRVSARYSVTTSTVKVESKSGEIFRVTRFSNGLCELICKDFVIRQDCQKLRDLFAGCVTLVQKTEQQRIQQMKLQNQKMLNTAFRMISQYIK